VILAEKGITCCGKQLELATRMKKNACSCSDALFLPVFQVSSKLQVKNTILLKETFKNGGLR